MRPARLRADHIAIGPRNQPPQNLAAPADLRVDLRGDLEPGGRRVRFRQVKRKSMQPVLENRPISE